MPIELSEEEKQALRDLSPNMAEIEQELKRAEMAGINVTRLRQAYQTVATQHAGLLQHYVNNPTQQARRRA